MHQLAADQHGRLDRRRQPVRHLRVRLRERQCLHLVVAVIDRKNRPGFWLFVRLLRFGHPDLAALEESTKPDRHTQRFRRIHLLHERNLRRFADFERRKRIKNMLERTERMSGKIDAEIFPLRTEVLHQRPLRTVRKLRIRRRAFNTRIKDIEEASLRARLFLSKPDGTLDCELDIVEVSRTVKRWIGGGERIERTAAHQIL